MYISILTENNPKIIGVNALLYKIKNYFSFAEYKRIETMFQPKNLNNPPTTSKPEGRSGILQVLLCSAVFVVGYLKNSQNAEHKRKCPSTYY